ncbi:MAG: tetratricopeptide repeat protein [Thermodesulfobacteriota bacterium]
MSGARIIKLVGAGLMMILLSLQAQAGGMDDYLAGREAAKNRQMDEAIKLYTKAIDSGELKEKDLAQAYNSRGNAWFDKGDLDQAIADYTRAIEADPKNGYAYYSRAFAHDHKGQADKAISDFTKAIEINPRDADSYFGRGNAWFDKKDLNKAIADFSKAVEFNPNLADAYYNRAVAYANNGEWDKAYQDAKKALSLSPNNKTYQSLVNETEARSKKLK